MKNKSSKQVYMKINQLHKLFGDTFSDIFKSITFDNGSEFSRYKDIEKKPGTKNKRTTVYFTHPYRSCERGSNENCNGLVRYFIKKGTDINTLSSHDLKDMNIKIHEKRGKSMVTNHPLSSSYRNLLPFFILLIFISIFHSCFYLQFRNFFSTSNH